MNLSDHEILEIEETPSDRLVKLEKRKRYSFRQNDRRTMYCTLY